MRFSRDEDLDAWYTTMLNHTQRSSIEQPYQVGPSATARCHPFSLRSDTIGLVAVFNSGPKACESWCKDFQAPGPLFNTNSNCIK